MKIYFYSKINAYLKINGEYKGVVSKNVNALDIKSTSDCLFEFLPLNDDFLPCYGKIGCAKISVYSFAEGILLFPKYHTIRNRPYEIFDFKKFHLGGNDVYVKTYSDGGIMYDIDGTHYVRGELPFTPSQIDAKDLGLFKAYVFTDNKSCVVIHSDNSGNAVFKDVLSEYSFINGHFTAIKKITNSTIPFILKEHYSVDNSFTLISRETEFLKSPFMVNESLLDFAFLELILKKADISSFLSADLRSKSNDLYSFLGQVHGAFCFNECGKIKTAVIENDKISYITFEKSDCLITNVSLID